MSTATTTAPVIKEALKRERRTNRRLRVVIDTMSQDARVIRQELDVQCRRIAQMQAELDRLRHAVANRDVTAGRASPRLDRGPTRAVRTSGVES